MSGLRLVTALKEKIICCLSLITHGKTEEEVAGIFKKYIPVLTDEPIDIDYQSVENGG